MRARRLPLQVEGVKGTLGPVGELHGGHVSVVVGAMLGTVSDVEKKPPRVRLGMKRMNGYLG